METLQPLNQQTLKFVVEVWQRKNKLLWKKKQSTVSRETTDKIERKRKFQRVREKIRNLPEPFEARPSTSSSRQTQPEDRIEIEASEPADTEVMYCDLEKRSQYRR